MDNLKGRNWDNLIVDVQNMTWSPIHVTQRLQESRVEFDRAVLIGCKTYSKEPGTIECYKWSSGKIEDIKKGSEVIQQSILSIKSKMV